MTPLALSLVLTAAVLHAVWNLSAKRAGSGLPFVFAVGIVMTAYYLPLVVGMLLWSDDPSLNRVTIGVIAVSTVLKTGYALYLQRAYRSGDFSLIYPLVRGSAPLLAMLGAVLFLGERPAPPGHRRSTVHRGQHIFSKPRRTPLAKNDLHRSRCTASIASPR